jgi:aryl-alcohol dehydrogenase-like predicted oxidoreductase
MERVTLGMTHLEVSPICFGTWQLGGDWGAFDKREAIEAIQRARELGINFFDSAAAYGWGASEKILGRALADELGSNRDELVIATKGGLRMEGDRLTRDSSPSALRDGVEASLRALGVDHIDVYQLHWPDPNTPLAETAKALQGLVDEGKIRHVGASNFSPQQMAEFARTRPLETLQPVYHLFRREVEDEVLPYCAEHDIGVFVYAPLGHGLLTGTMTEDQRFAEGDWRAGSSLFRGDAFKRNLGVVDELKAFAEERRLTISQLAVAWVLANPAVHAAIVGTRNPAHIVSAVEASERRLSEEDLAEIDRIMEGAVQVGGPTPESI